MARVSGIQFEKDANGNTRYDRIDLKEHGSEITPFLEKIGAIEPDEFDSAWSKSITGEELMKRLKPRIKKLFEK